MAQQFNYPNSETELRAIQDELYRTAKDAHDTGNRPSFGGLIEIMSAKATIITAIHNIKANKGANTPGVDGISIRRYLQSREDWVINDIQSAFRHYVPKMVRRKYIDKPGKTEKKAAGYPHDTGQNVCELYWSPLWKLNSMSIPTDSGQCATPKWRWNESQERYIRTAGTGL